MTPENQALILVTQVTAERGVYALQRQSPLPDTELKAGLLFLDHGVIAGGKATPPSEMEELALLTRAGYSPQGEYHPGRFPWKGIGWMPPSLAEKIVVWQHECGWLYAIHVIGGNAPGWLVAAQASKRLLPLGATPDPLIVLQETERLLRNPNLPPPKRITLSYLERLYNSLEGRASV